MECSLARESLSAWVDREQARAQPIDVAEHLATCPACRAYADRLGGLTELTSALQLAGPGTTSRAPSAATGQVARPRSRRVQTLRLAVVVLSVLELAAALAEVAADHGYRGEVHAGHESLSFTLAICAGLLWISWQPSYARSYLPLLGVAAALLIVTATVDVLGGEAHLLDEVPHLGFGVAFVLLWLISHDRGLVRTPPSPRVPRGATATTGRRLRVVRGSLRAAIAATVPVLVLVAAPSFSHATLEASTPGQDALVRTLPTVVTLRFDEPVTTLPTSLEVYAPDGSRVDDGTVTHPDGDGAQVSVGVTGRQHGTYLVSWRVVSADSHPVSGAFVFSVGARSATPSAPAQQGDRLLGSLLGASRWLGYLGSALGVGGVFFLTVCWPQGRDRRGPRRLVLVGVVGLIVGAALSILLKGPDDAALGFSAVGRGSLLHEVVGSTYGHAQIARIVLAVLLGILFAVSGDLVRRWRLAAMAGVGLATLATFAAAGHALTDHPSWISIPVDMAHVAAMSVWLGGLVNLTAFVLRGAHGLETAVAATGRFSRVALGAVGTLIATGTYQGWRQVRSWGALTGTTYGRELLVKVGLVALILVVAEGSRRWVRRRSAGRSAELHVLRRRVALEAVGIVAVLGVTSALVATAPARTAYQPSVSANLTLGPDVVQVSAVPAGDRRMQVHIYVFDRQGRPTEPKELTASLTLASHHIGPLPLTLTPAGRGHRIAVVSVPVEGDWSMAVDVRTSAIDEFTKSVTLPIR